MIITCKVIEDLLPLYADGICSEDSRTVVEHHTAVCPECKAKMEAMTVKIEKREKKATIDNPFKKVRNHYIKLAVITLIVCALIVIPIGGAWYLKANELYDAGYSWATVRTAGKLKKIGDLMKKGKYREALDMFEPYCESDDYTESEINVFKDLYAEQFERCFDGNSIKTVSYYAEGDKCERSYLHISASDDFINENRMDTFTLVFGYDTKGDLQFIEYEGEDNAELILPNMRIPSKKSAENYFDSLKDDAGIRNFAYKLYTEERVNSVLNGEEYDNVSLLGKTVMKNEGKIKAMLENYRYIGCKGGEVRLGSDDWEHYSAPFKGHSLYLQKAAVTMETMGGEEFTVEFDLPINSFVTYTSNVSKKPLVCNEYASLLNITYSENTPEDFKLRFEEIFA